MKLEEIVLLLTNAAHDGAGKAFTGQVIVSEFLSKSQAYQLYGRSNVDRWLCEKLIKINERKLNRTHLEAIAAASNRITYLPVAER